MKKKELLRQLNNLQDQIKPDQVWKEKGREVLYAQINAQTSSVSPKVISQTITNKIIISVLRPVSVSLAIFIAIIGVWVVGVNATKNSLPGDLLYGLKLTGERLQVNLALSDEKRTDLEIAFAEIRLNEVKEVMTKTKDKGQLAVSLKKFQESMSNVKSNLAKLEMTDKDKALKVAKVVDEKTKIYTDLLRGENIVSDKNTNEAIAVSKATGDKALSVILKEFEEGDSATNLEDIKSKLIVRIEDLREDSALAQKNIETIIINKAIAEELAKAQAEAKAKAEEEARIKAEEEAKAQAEAEAKEAEIQADETSTETANTESTEPSLTEENLPETTNTNTDTNNNINTNTNSEVIPEEVVEPPIEEILPTIDEVKENPDKIEKLLVKAEDFLKSNSVSQAFEQIRQADDLLNILNKVINANSQYLEALEENTIEVDAAADVEGVKAEEGVS
ncbi:hypothetical protein JW977_04605 [Candidatus Falkowbacteria bacterium]|nr:hypothetical protein [Candidatus Falkowbacteria bacterium]